MLYQLLTGHLPFGGSADLVLNESMPYDPKPLRQYNPSIPVALETVVLRCLSKSPSSRYDTASDFADALRAWKGTATVTVNFEQTKSWSRLLGFTALVTLGLLAVVGSWMAVSESRSADNSIVSSSVVANANTVKPVRNAEDLTPNAWNNLLDRKPVAFLFPLDPIASHWLYDDDRETLQR